MNTDQPSGCLAALFNLFRSSPSQSTAQEQAGPLPYRLRSDFLSPAELSFYNVLRSVVEGHATINAKVRLADVFFIPKNDNRQTYQNKISQKHLDFLLCDPRTIQPLLGIELDDRSHQQADRAERDTFVDAVFEAARLPLIHVQAKHAYSYQEVEGLILPHITEQLSPPVVPLALPQESAPTCLNCGTAMVRRTSKRGDFYGCSNYPQCRSIVPITT